MKFLLFAILSAGSLLSAADFFPLTPGNTWTLRSASGARHEVRVGFTLRAKDDQAFYHLTGYRSEGSWLRRDARGQLLWLEPETEVPELLTSFEPSKDGYNTHLGACAQTARVQEERVEWGAPGRQLPALKIQYEGGCPDNAITEELYLENIGLVRRVVSTFAGPVTFYLQEARVGNLIYLHQAGVFFDMSLPSGTLKSDNGEVLTKITLRLSARDSEPIRLLYSSGQQYEFKLFNRSGDLVWKWSQDRVFIPAVSEDFVLDRTWERNVLMEGVAPGEYTLEGSLTNSGPNRFATSMTLRID
jgi:hypothetical protein